MKQAGHGVVGRCQCDNDQRILTIDDAFLSIIGRERQDIIGKHGLDFTLPEYRPLNVQLLNKLKADNQAFSITKRYVRGDGSVVWVTTHVTPLDDGYGRPQLSVTSSATSAPIVSEPIKRTWQVAKHATALLRDGKKRLGRDIISTPPVETLLHLYMAEDDGRTLTVKDVAEHIQLATPVTIRWIAALQSRNLVQLEIQGQLSASTPLRITHIAYREMDDILAGNFQ